MKVVPVALYVGDIPEAPSDPRIRRRYRKKALSSQVDCVVQPLGESFMAVPAVLPTPHRRAQFRLQLRVGLVGGLPDDVFGFCIQPVNETQTSDPDQTIFAPIYAGPDRLIFEFIRAEVIWCGLDGSSGVRFLAINPASGEIGSRDRQAQADVYATVLARCRGQLGGDAPLFAIRHDLRRPARRIPAGEPRLLFP